MVYRLAVLLTAAALVAGLAGICILAVWKSICRCEMFRISRITIEGCSHISKEEVMRLSQVTSRSNTLSLDPDRIAASIEQHQWVESVAVRRKLPDHLIISIKEYRPAALLNAGRLYMVDKNGHIFKKLTPEENLDLPIITGVKLDFQEDGRSVSCSGSAAAHILRALELIDMAGRGTRMLGSNNISEINISEDGRLTLYTADKGIPFCFGPQKLRTQFVRAEKILYQLYRSGKYDKVVRVDLAYTEDTAMASLKN